MHADDIDMITVKLAQHLGANHRVGAAAHRPAMGEIDDTVHHRQQRVHVVCGEQHRGLELPRQAAQQGDDPGNAAHVQIGERFVQQQQARTPDQGVRDQHPLLLAAGQAADPLIGERRRIHRIEHLVDLPPTPRRGQRHPQPVAIEAERHEIARAHRHVGIERKFLRHVADRGRLAAAVDDDAAAAGHDEAEDGAQQRRLA